MTLDTDLATLERTLECPNADAPFHTAGGCTWCAGTLPALDALRNVKAALREKDAEIARLQRRVDILYKANQKQVDIIQSDKRELARLQEGLREIAADSDQWCEGQCEKAALALLADTPGSQDSAPRHTATRTQSGEGTAAADLVRPFPEGNDWVRGAEDTPEDGAA